MSNKTVRSIQGQMWDQIAVAKLNNEKDMRDIVDINVDYADCLDLESELKISVPEKATITPTRTLPPWER